MTECVPNNDKSEAGGIAILTMTDYGRNIIVILLIFLKTRPRDRAGVDAAFGHLFYVRRYMKQICVQMHYVRGNRKLSDSCPECPEIR